MADQSTQGPVSLEDLLAVWESATDSSYNRPFIEAGDGDGLEVYTQGFAQLHRVSQAIDVTTQAMYILPFSGQTNPPAGGPARATVPLTLTRGGLFDKPLVLGAGTLVFDERAFDASEEGQVRVETGRRYVLRETVVFFPGEQGPLTAEAEAEKPGYGYNNPLPGTIDLVEQPGSGFNNVLAAVIVDAGAALPGTPVPARRARVRSANVADMFVPDHVGQYVSFVSGANAGRVGRVTAFASPDPALNQGSTVDVEILAATTAFAGNFAGTFQVGEVVELVNFVTLMGRGVVLAARLDAGGDLRVAFVVTQGRGPIFGDTLVGTASGATANVDFVQQDGTFAAEAPSGGSGGAGWRVLDWASDWGLAAGNEESPSGGRLGMLDLLGAERNLPRQDGEADDEYRERVAQVADVVTPNAIRRALNRAMGGFPWCFREVGSALLPGLFFDRTGDADGDFYDTECVVYTGVVTSGAFVFQERVEYRNAAGDVLLRGFWGSYLTQFNTPARSPDAGLDFTVASPRGRVGAVQIGDVVVGLQSGAVLNVNTLLLDNRANDAFRVWLDYTDFRAFFLVSVPNVGFGEFGCAYDAGPSDAYDCAPYLAFFDGFPAGAPAFYTRVFNAVDKVRAGGVTFRLYLSRGEPCA